MSENINSIMGDGENSLIGIGKYFRHHTFNPSQISWFQIQQMINQAVVDEVNNQLPILAITESEVNVLIANAIANFLTGTQIADLVELATNDFLTEADILNLLANLPEHSLNIDAISAPKILELLSTDSLGVETVLDTVDLSPAIPDCPVMFYSNAFPHLAQVPMLLNGTEGARSYIWTVYDPNGQTYKYLVSVEFNSANQYIFNIVSNSMIAPASYGALNTITISTPNSPLSNIVFSLDGSTGEIFANLASGTENLIIDLTRL